MSKKIKFGNWVEKNREYFTKFWRKETEIPFLIEFCTSPLMSNLKLRSCDLKNEVADFQYQMEGIRKFLEIIPEPVETFVPMLSPMLQDDAVIPSAFGMDFHYGNDGVLRWKGKIKTLEQAVDWPDPDPQKDGWLPKALKKIEYFSRNAPEEVVIKSTPMRGPWDNAQLILGMEELSIGFYEKPELVHRFLHKLTKTQISLLKLEKEIAEANGCLFRHDHIMPAFFPEESDYCIAADNCINISPKMYKEFCSPYDEMIFKELNGGGLIHSCGPIAEYVPVFMGTQGCIGVTSSMNIDKDNIPQIFEKLSSTGGSYHCSGSFNGKSPVEMLSYLREEANKYGIRFAYIPSTKQWKISPDELKDVYNYWLSVRQK
ncbi:hypothetical protein KAW08_02205 [bacterium]|nr:hypothetical protein [bacterium]